MTSLFGAIGALVGVYFLSKVWKLYTNYQVAAKSGLPILIWPVDPESIIFIVTQGALKLLLRALLPARWNVRARVGLHGWEFEDKNAIHERVGPAFMLVSAGINQLWVADPAMTTLILTRRKDFVQLPLASKIMGCLGSNMISSDGEAWARQRRIVAPNLNERISDKVWAESLQQTRQMADFFARMPTGPGVRDHTIGSLRGVTINVLGSVGYDQPKPFQPMELPRKPDAPMTYVEAISLVSQLLVLVALFPGWLLRLPFMPEPVRTVGAAMARLPGLTKALLDDERSLAAETDEPRDNLMSLLVRLSDQGKAEAKDNKASDAGTGQFLTEDEIAGNLFLFTGAGFDTTATTLTFTIALLATYPEVQTWIQEEIDVVLGEAGKNGTPDYTNCFPRLNRCLSLMLETLRLFPPVNHISRGTTSPQTLSVNDATYTIPGPCTVYVNSVGLQCDRSSWGEDALSFRPSRWLVPNAVLGAENQILTPKRGTFIPWSAGPRVCPGQKMAQVEFVSIVSSLFQRLRVEPAPDDKGRGLQEMRDYFGELMQDSDTRLTLQMNRQEELRLRWLER